MKKFKRITSLVLALCLCFGCVAMNNPATVSAASIKENDIAPVSAYNPVENNYNNVWLNKSGTGSFRVYNTTKGKIGFTFQVESDYSGAWATMYVTNPSGGTVLTPVSFIGPNTPKSSREYILKNAQVGYYTIHYTASTSNNKGMRINCWTYKWYDWFVF